MSKKLFIFLVGFAMVLLAAGAGAQTPVEPVRKLSSTDRLTEDLKVPDGKSFEIEDGGTLTFAAGANFSGDGAGLVSAIGAQAEDSDLSLIAVLTTTSYGRGVLSVADASALRAYAGLGTAATLNTGTSVGNVPVLGSGGALTLTGALTAVGAVISPGGDLAFSNSGFLMHVQTATLGSSHVATIPAKTGTFSLVANSSGLVNVGSEVTGTLPTANIADDAVTNAKLANMSQATIKGRASGAGTGDVTDLTADQASAVLDEAADPFRRTSSAPPGTWVLLGTATASASSQINVDNVVTSDYDLYRIEFVNLLPATDAVKPELVLRTSAPANVGGTYRCTWQWLSANSVNTDTDLGQTGVNGWSMVWGASNSAGSIRSGYAEVDLTSNSAAKTAHWHFTAFVNSSLIGDVTGSGYNSDTSAVAGFGFAFSSGNVTSGSIRVFGRKKP